MTGTATLPGRTRQRKRFAVDVPFVKQASTAPDAQPGDLVLTGYANTWVQDRDGDWMARDAFDNSLADYLSKNPILLNQHNMKQPLGTVAEMYTDDTGLFCVATVPKPPAEVEKWKHSAYHDIASGILRTFSIGGYFTYDIENWGEDDEKWIIAEVELMELSVVSIPSNPDSIFEAAMKAVKGGDEDAAVGSKMSDKAFDQMLQILGIAPVTDPELVGKDPVGLGERYASISKLFARVKGREAPAMDSYVILVAQAAAAPDVLAQAPVLAQITELVDSLYAAPTTAVVPAPLDKGVADRLTEARDILNELLGV